MRGRGVTAEETLSTAVRKTDSRGVVMAHGNDCGHHYRRNILLLVLQVWIVPCHGFLFVPHGCSRPLVTSSALHAPSAASTWGTRTGGSGSRIARLSMSDRGPRSDEVPSEDMPGAKGPGPYRDEHESGGTRFRELLARAKKTDPYIEQRAGVRPTSSRGQQQQDGRIPREARPPRPVRPADAPNYDDPAQWDRIGSPSLPDPPLRNEMPGMQLPREMDADYGDDVGATGGSRFRDMMEKARANDERRQMGQPPRSRGDGETPPRPPPQHFTPEEKARATRAAVERQQKLMMKEKGIDLDDPSLDNAELQKMRAVARAKAEATSGYVPSTSASDDYIDQLSTAARKKKAEFLKRVNSGGDPVVEMDDSPMMPEVDQQEHEPTPALIPRRRTKATTSIQNESDAYIAALSGKKVEITKNPYLEEQSTSSFIEIEDDSLRNKILAPPPSRPRPTGPVMSYAERLKNAREEKAGEQAAITTPPAASAPQSAAAVPSAQTMPPPATRSSLSYAERLQQAREAKAAATGGARAAAGGSPVAPSREVPQQQPAVTIREVPQPQSADPLLGRAGSKPEAKMMHVMDLLTQHKTAGLTGEAKLQELRDALTETRELLRSEAYGGSPPPITTAAPVAPAAPRPATPQRASPAAATPSPLAAAAAPRANPGSAPQGAAKDIFRRCSGLVQAHAHSSLSGNDLMALREHLGAALKIVEVQIDNGGLFEDAWSVGGDHTTEPAAPAAAEPATPPPPDVSSVQQPPVPASAGGIPSVGGVLQEMGVGNRPATFEPETAEASPDARLGPAPRDKSKGWTDGSLGDYEKKIATKGLGYLLKHKGGKGYGRGRCKGIEAENLVATLAELTEIFHDEMVED